jgi:thiamine-phosphate pyrophosphorylase
VNWAVLRVIDANLNRAHEALRTLEEFARFVLEDSALCGAIKTARHQLFAAVPPTLWPELLSRRDVALDPGRELSAPLEFERTAVEAVARAAGRRLGEALRAVEEYAKTFDAEFAARVERIRYQAYELEQRTMLTVKAHRRTGAMRLVVLITEAQCLGDWWDAAQAALDGGADCLQLREKQLPDAELLRRARRLADLCRERGALFMVNDRADLAAASHAHGVHLGQDDLPVSLARRFLPVASICGVSTHDLEQVRIAAAACPDYIAVGLMFSSSTKPSSRLAGVATLAAAREHTSLPLIAIGGIDENNVHEVLAARPCGVAVCAAVIGRPDVSAAASRLRAAVDDALGADGLPPSSESEKKMEPAPNVQRQNESGR